MSSRLDHEVVEGDRLVYKPHSRAAGDKLVAGTEVESETSADELEPEGAAMTFIRRRQTESHRRTLHGRLCKS